MTDLSQYLKHPQLAVTGRVETALKYPEMGTLPASCTTFVAGLNTLTGILEMVQFVSKALRTGAGVNVHLDSFEASERDPATTIAVYVNPDHQDAHETGLVTDLPDWVAPNDILRVSDSMEDYDQSYLPGGANVSLMPIDRALWFAVATGYWGESLVVDLSHLRPAHVENAHGMVSSGPVSFARMFQAAFEFGRKPTIKSLLGFLSSFNGELRRGGRYKNGAITTSLPMWHPNALEYIQLPTSDHPWLKKGLVIPRDWANFDLLPAILRGVNNGTLWLEKSVRQTTQDEHEANPRRNHIWLPSDSPEQANRLRSNVCREILLPHRGTCTLSGINLGATRRFEDLPGAFRHAMEFLCELHKANHVAAAGIYLDASEDKQVGLWVIGLANLLAAQGITYKELTVSLSDLIQKQAHEIRQASMGLPSNLHLESSEKAPTLAYWLARAFAEAAVIARSYGMERAFTVAPTASCSYRYEDLEGFTTTPEISPPVYREVERMSETVASEFVFYGPNVETAETVGAAWYTLLVDAWQSLMNCTGLAHSISYNVWEDFDQLQWDFWTSSKMVTTYYRLDVTTGYLDKADQFGCKSCAE